MVGKMHFEVIYVPFEGVRTHSASKKTDDDDEDYEDHNSNAASKARNAVRNLNQITDEDKGILTVTLTGCMNLQVPSLHPLDNVSFSKTVRWSRV